MKTIPVGEAFDKYHPNNVVFVISYDDKKRRPSGMVAGWTTECSTDPYMYAVALWKKGYTHKLIQKTGEFVVAVPNKSLEKAIDIFGKKHGDKVNKFKVTKIATTKARFTKTPLISEATINFECKLEKEVDAGDHIIFIGKVLAAHINEKKKVLINMGKKNGKRVFREF